jgi:hypothetical protein
MRHNPAAYTATRSRLNPPIQPIPKTKSALPVLKPAHDSPPEKAVQWPTLIQDTAAFTECQDACRRECFSSLKFQVSSLRSTSFRPSCLSARPLSPARTLLHNLHLPFTQLLASLPRSAIVNPFNQLCYLLKYVLTSCLSFRTFVRVSVYLFHPSSLIPLSDAHDP